MTNRGSIPKTAFFQNFANGRIATRIAVTGVYGGLAKFPVIAGSAQAFIIPFARRPASSAVLTRESITRVALSQDLVRYFT